MFQATGLHCWAALDWGQAAANGVDLEWDTTPDYSTRWSTCCNSDVAVVARIAYWSGILIWIFCHSTKQHNDDDNDDNDNNNNDEDDDDDDDDDNNNDNDEDDDDDDDDDDDNDNKNDDNNNNNDNNDDDDNNDNNNDDDKSFLAILTMSGDLPAHTAPAGHMAREACRVAVTGRR